MSAYTAHLHMETGAPFAQIVLQPLGRDHVDRVEFDVIHDDRTKMRYNAVLPYQTAGEFKRKTHHLITALYTGRHGDFRAYAVSLWSRALTPSGATRYHTVEGGQITYVQLEGVEIEEVWRRLNSVPYDERSSALVGYARELAPDAVPLQPVEVRS